jgi:hypothetical protein
VWKRALHQFSACFCVRSPPLPLRPPLSPALPELQRVPLLCTYLEALHAAGRADQAHTTLLLNCFTKLRRMDKLKSFIRGDSGASHHQSTPAVGGSSYVAQAGSPAPLPSSSSALSFDVRTAIPVLRDAGCYSEAIYLAELHGHHDWLIRLLLEQQQPAAASTKTIEESAAASVSAESSGMPAASGASSSKAGASAALSYITRLPFADAERYLLRYGREIGSACPDETIAVIVMMCTRYKRAAPFIVVSSGDATVGGGDKDVAPSVQLENGGGGYSTVSADSPPLPSRSTANLRQCSAQPAVYLPLFADRPGPLKALCSALVAAAARNEIPPVSAEVWHALLDASLRPEFKETR